MYQLYNTIQWVSNFATRYSDIYCKFKKNFPEFYIRDSIKTHLRRKKSRTGHDLPISVNDRVKSPICESQFDFRNMQSFARIKLSRKFSNLQYSGDIGPECLSLCLLGNFPCFNLSSADFFQNSFWNTIRVSNSLNPDQARHFVWPDLGPNCLQRLAADDTSRQRVTVK